MTTKTRRRKRSQAVASGGEQSPVVERFHPKPGPGQQFKREVVADLGVGHAVKRRYRNVKVTPLMAAFEGHKLDCDAERTWRRDPQKNRAPAILSTDRLECGERFAKWWYNKMASPSRDSTIQGIGGGGGGRTLTEVQEHSDREVQRMRRLLSSRNYLIVEAFCGEGYSMLDALRKAGIEAHPVGTAYRIREALDELVCVITGRIAVPILVPAAKR